MTPAAPIALPAVDLGVVAPIVVAAVTAMVLMVLSAALSPRRSGILAGVALVGLAIALVADLGLWGASRAAFHDAAVADNLFVYFGAVAIAVAFLTVLLSAGYLSREQLVPGEYYALVLFATVGSLVLVAARDLIVVLLGLEVLSLSLYVLAGYARGRLTSEEAALKYFLLGAFSFGFLVYGSALIFGATGTTDYGRMAAALAKAGPTPLLYVGLGLLLVGFAFKLSFVPFHMWTPDVYEGAPTTVTAFMSVGTKAAVFGALLRLLAEALPAARPGWAPILWALALLTMVFGNVAAIAQRNVKRMLAYSSIAQAGYILVALVSADRLGVSGVFFYVAAYAFMNLGAFAVVVALAQPGDRGMQIADYAGLGTRSPWLAAAMTLFMLSLAGVPPTAGFLAKLYVFSAAIQAGYADLAIVGVLTSAAAVSYYLWLVVQMYMRPPTPELKLQPIRVPAALLATLLVAAFFTLELGILPALPLDAAQASLAGLALGR